MARISDLPLLALATIDGTETALIIKDGVTYRADLAGVPAPQAKFHADRASQARAALEQEFARLSAVGSIDAIAAHPELLNLRGVKLRDPAVRLGVQYWARDLGGTRLLARFVNLDSGAVYWVGFFGGNPNPTTDPGMGGGEGVHWIDILEGPGKAIGQVLIHLNGGGVTWGTSAAFDPAAVPISTGTQGFAEIERETITKLARDAARGSPLLESVTDPYMRRIVREGFVDGGDDQIDGRYILNYETANIGGGNGRVTFLIRDRLLGIDVCARRILDTQENLRARTTPTIVLNQAYLPGYTGITATLWIDWAAITFDKPFTAYTSAQDAGLRGNRVHTPDRMRIFGYRAEPKIRFTVGAGPVTARHFNSYAAAIASLYIPDISITRSTYECTDICSFANQVLIECLDDNYSETIDATTIAGVDQSTALVVPFLTLRGGPDGKTELRMAPAEDNSAPVLEAPFSFRIERFAVFNLGSGYSVHMDGANRARRATVGPPILREPVIQVIEDCRPQTSDRMLTWNLGVGLSNGHWLRIVRSRVLLARPGQGLGIHNTPNTTDAGLIEFVDSGANDDLYQGANAIALLKSFAMNVQHTIVVSNSDIARIKVDNGGGGAAGFRRAGRIDPDIAIIGDLAA